MDKYLKLDLIGKGCNGNCVIKVKNLEENKIYALKRIFIDVNDQEQNKKNMNEINIFKILHHQNIVGYLESFIHKNKFCIIMEWADGGDLGQIIKKNTAENKPIEEDLIWIWFLQICQALKYIHSKKILHRDIKSQNIFLTKKGQIKLGDFGISKVLENTMDYAKTSLGTPYFFSPEICSGHKYNFKTDIWMLGCVLYELTCLRKPFEGENFHKLIINILTCDILPIPKIYSNELNTLVEMLLKKDPNLRPSVDEILSLDFVEEKMSRLSSKFPTESESRNNTQSKQSSSNLLNMNSNSTNYNSNNNYFSSSPLHELNNECNFQLFNLGFGNLLNEIDEVDEEHNINSISMSPTNYEKNIQLNTQNSSKNENINKGTSLFAHRKHKKYSPSYGVNDMSKVLRQLNSENLDEENLDQIVNELKQSLGKIQNRISVPENQRNNMSIEEKIKRVRTKSINIENINKMQYINQNQDSPNKKHHKVHSIVNKHLNSNPSSNNSTANNTIMSNINLNIQNLNVNSANSKYKQYKESIASKKKLPKQFSLNITSIQSPEHKAIYFKENESSDFKVELQPTSGFHRYYSNIQQTISIDTSSPQVNPKDPTKFTSRHPKINYLIEDFGEEKINQLLFLLENADNPVNFLKDGREIEKIIGEKYKTVQNILLGWLRDQNQSKNE